MLKSCSLRTLNVKDRVLVSKYYMVRNARHAHTCIHTQSVIS